ncbi:MAG: response regulator, partial [Glaciimonas sp.]|nr:response regulator [Glaciimonas sp.]
LLHVSRDEVRDERQDEIQNDSEENNGETGFEIAVENTPIISSSIVVSEPAPTHAVTQVVPVMQIAATVPRLFTPTEEEFDASLALRDDLDADLLPVFLEEGHDILPQIGGALRDWQQEAGTSNNAMPVATIQAILRHLHTIKGSARMAGAMVLGQHMHEMESQIEVISQRSKGNADSVRSGEELQFEIEELLTHYDHGVQLFDNLHLPKDQQVPLARSAATVFSSATSSILSVTPRPVMATSTVSGTPAILTPAHMPVQAVQQVRVNADILDRLVNQAGEVSITRSRLESGVGHLQQSLSELTENVDRLRQQLREIEMQAETQMSSRMSRLGEAGERKFDPLEFDRFTRLQELTRMMAESVNDVGMLQKTLTHTANDASATLVAQGLLTRDLQQDLMHVRMVQFASVAERLYRLTRQVSKEVDKRVTLDIRGSSVEMDRGVLEKMVGPFEHLLRNAIVHGIESRDARRAAGKNDIGELKIEIRQDGNEVLIQLTDDGQGLNLPQIREKAHHTGLLSVDQAMDPSLSDGEISELIFKPGFSTASEVTELAGRGVGMDVVRSEATSLGGRVAVSTQTGEGTTFSIHLPLTLAVMQVVIFTTGGATYAVPSALVEQVQQLKSPMLAAAYNDGAIQWQGQRVPMHYLSALLGEHDVTPVSQQYSPIVILKSGNERVAVHVDAIAGNREVVVKNIGPQLSRMIGIVGATVLGSGDIVLILNPVPLALRYAQEVRAPRTGMTGVDVDAVEDVGAVAEIAKQAQNAAQGLRTQKIVMVVDDSLTVRRVTQRLLLRESYQVVLAKDGVDALQQLQAITPDVMLVDIEMPRMDGFDLTRNIRSDERTRHIPIIMITSRTATKHRDYAMELGVNEYLGKPYQEDALLSAIKGFVQRELML